MNKFILNEKLKIFGFVKSNSCSQQYDTNMTKSWSASKIVRYEISIKYNSSP